MKIKQIKACCCFLLASLLVPFQLLAGNLTKSGTTAAQFLKIPVGARAIGMGGSFVALANDVSSLYWNPAGMTKVGSTGGVNFSYTNWLADTKFNYAAVVVDIATVGRFGLHFTSLSMPDMEVRTEFEPEGTGEFFSALDLEMGLSYARAITDRFSLGFTAKYIREQIWHMSASSIAFDVGILFQTDFDWLVLGVSVSNFGPKMQFVGKDVFINYDFTPDQWGDNENIFANLQTDKWDLPLLFRFGLSIELWNNDASQFITTLEARHPNDNTESLSLGFEYGFLKRFFLRGGYQALFEAESERGLTFGLGVVYYLSRSNPLHFDYAYADWNRLNNVHRFSIELKF
ncbi:MAG TPA: PorV/PorQ family protein [bacterium]|nr:PorV/PorQ family protein [bacterium]